MPCTAPTPAGPLSPPQGCPPDQLAGSDRRRRRPATTLNAAGVADARGCSRDPVSDAAPNSVVSTVWWPALSVIWWAAIPNAGVADVVGIGLIAERPERHSNSRPRGRP